MDADEEIKIRIVMARKIFIKYSSMLLIWNLSLYTRLRFIGYQEWLALMYGMETWTLKAHMIRKLEFEMWLYKKHINDNLD